MSDGGKGSRPRPFSISQQEWESRWDAIFGKDIQEPKHGEQRISSTGELEEYREGYWIQIKSDEN